MSVLVAQIMDSYNSTFLLGSGLVCGSPLIGDIRRVNKVREAWGLDLEIFDLRIPGSEDSKGLPGASLNE